MSKTVAKPASKAANAPTLNIGDKNYPIDSLNQQARVQVDNLRIVDAEITRLQNQLGIAQAARSSFIAALQAQVQ